MLTIQTDFTAFSYWQSVLFDLRCPSRCLTFPLQTATSFHISITGTAPRFNTYCIMGVHRVRTHFKQQIQNKRAKKMQQSRDERPATWL